MSPPSEDPVYSSRDVERLVEVRTLVERMNSINKENSALHKNIEEMKTSIIRVHERLDSKDIEMVHCKTSLQKETEDKFVTKTELDIALERLLLLPCL